MFIINTIIAHILLIFIIIVNVFTYQFSLLFVQCMIYANCNKHFPYLSILHSNHLFLKTHLLISFLLLCIHAQNTWNFGIALLEIRECSFAVTIKLSLNQLGEVFSLGRVNPMSNFCSRSMAGAVPSTGKSAIEPVLTLERSKGLRIFGISSTYRPYLKVLSWVVWSIRFTRGRALSAFSVSQLPFSSPHCSVSHILPDDMCETIT